MSKCNGEITYPPLAEPYATALHECVEFALGEFDVLGIIATGTVLRGNPDPASDLDVYVVTPKRRQRMQRFFNGVPTELFINPPSSIRQYLKEETAMRRPCTAHMLATGTIILKNDAVIDELITEARNHMAIRPEVSDDAIRDIRYVAACHLEDADDLVERDPVASAWKYMTAAQIMIEYLFAERRMFRPRDKDLLAEVRKVDGDLGALVDAVITSSDLTQRRQSAHDLADRTIGVHGFFEWDSKPEEIC